MSRPIIWAAIISALALGTVLLWRAKRQQPLPYHDSFVQNHADEWQQFGGVWQLGGGAIYNRSDERGAKLLTGSPKWKNYQLTSDVQFIGHDGDVGVMVRVQDAERGIDSYNGYYVGLRSSDSALVIGRADYGWMEVQPVALRGGVRLSNWYRLHVVAFDCNIGAEAINLQTGEHTYAALHEKPCVMHGAVGVRSMGTGGAWKNISVIAATQSDWDAIRKNTSNVTGPNFPDREADYSHMRVAYFGETYKLAREYPATVEGSPEGSGYDELTEKQLVAVEKLRKNTVPMGPVTLRGVVTLASPVYVQDATGGVAVEMKRPIPLNLGDEVQLSGIAINTGLSPRILVDKVRLLWDRTQLAPFSITSTQAASGAFASSLVGIQGTLKSKEMSSDGVVRLYMEDAAQSFVAILRGDLSSQRLNSIEPGSLVRVRGICDFTNAAQNGGSFAILLRSMDDVEVLSGPPWWSGKRVAQAILLGLVLIAIGVWIYLRIERWKMRAIWNERERLAHEMHDTLAQSFAGVGFHLQGLRNTLRSGKAKQEAVMEKLDVACDLVTQTHRDASAGIAALHPEADEGKDLLVALERCLHGMLEGDDLPISLVREGTPRPLSLPVRDALFRIGREAITNVLRHSNAARITLKLRYEPKLVRLEIQDDGRGFTYDPQNVDFGIRSMQKRAKTIDGIFTVETSPGRGTLLMVQAPYGRRFTFGDMLRAFKHALSHRSV